jgi:hypothetical protein
MLIFTRHTETGLAEFSWTKDTNYPPRYIIHEGRILGWSGMHPSDFKDLSKPWVVTYIRPSHP